MAKELGPLESRLLAYAQLRRLHMVRLGETQDPLQLSPQQERRLLGRLAAAGLIVRVNRGVYLLPDRLPLGGQWSPDERVSLAALISEASGRYQICGPTAFNYHGYDGQIATRTYAYNNRISGDRRIGSAALTFIKVADARLGDTVEVPVSGDSSALYSSRARTLLDAVYDWSRFDGLPRAYEWIRDDLHAGRVTAAALVRVTRRYGNQASIRRIGWLLERQSTPASCLRALERLLSVSSSPIPVNPTAGRRGRIDRRWGVIVNYGQ